jgi:hypothetical protein
LIEDPKIILPSKNDDFQAKIILKPKKFLGTEPIVEALDEQNTSVVPKREQGIAWEIVIYSRSRSITDDYTPKVLSSQRYRIELATE